MQHKDEEILMKQKAAAKAVVDEIIEEEKQNEIDESIYEGDVHIEGKTLTFSRRCIEEVGISLYMPDIFERMDDETRKLFYPLGNAPEYIYADPEFGVPFNIAIGKTQNIVPDDGIPKLMDMTEKLMNNYGPKAKVLSNGAVRLKDHNIGIMETVTRGLDGGVYNVMIYMSINNHVVIGNIHFATKYSKRLIPIAKQIIDSIEFLEEQDNGSNNLSES